VARIGIGRVATLACAVSLGCPHEDPEPVRAEVPAVDPRVACVESHDVSRRYRVVLRSLCAELHDLEAVGASVAIARDGEIVFATAAGRRCAGDPTPLQPQTAMPVGSISKVATAATVLTLAPDEADLDADLRGRIPELSDPISLRALLDHTSGLRDPPPLELLSAGAGWVRVVDQHREPPGAHHYANANYAVAGLWIERVAGGPLPEVWQARPELAALREAIAFDGRPLGEAAACGHVLFLGWHAVPLDREPRLPDWTLPAGGGLASAVSLAKLPYALQRAGLAQRMTRTTVATGRRGQRYGLGVRVEQSDGETVFAHAGNTGRFAADLQWSADGRVAVAVLSNTPRHFKATLRAAWTSAQNASPEGSAQPEPP
jgi:CubicO group peptidase (beta-lactamase class C family)